MLAVYRYTATLQRCYDIYGRWATAAVKKTRCFSLGVWGGNEGRIQAQATHGARVPCTTAILHYQPSRTTPENPCTTVHHYRHSRTEPEIRL